VKINDREWQRILGYIEKHVELTSPLKPLAQMLVDDFGWPASDGRKRALTILKQLEGNELIHCDYDRRGTPRTARFVEKETAKPVPKYVPTPTVQRIIDAPLPKLRKKASRLEEWEASQRNEERCYRLTTQLIHVLRDAFPEFTKTACTLSGRHNPQEGIVDIADHHGEDIGIELFAWPGDGSSLGGRIILDVKNHEHAAIERNKDIRFMNYEIETDVLLKKAIWVDPSRSDRKIVEVIFDYIVEAGFSFIQHRKDEILAQFTD